MVPLFYANQNLDTIYTKIYVGGLPWKTRNEGLRSFFERFEEIIDVNVICNRETGRSEGYGFVTFRDAESATRACEIPNPTIDGREAKCKLAYLGARV
ncbi:putative RNA-binding protein ARP1 [Cardamine amara subsp. amara]|uniref:RNA-binding protein ARP1 n=1 Tax=Cardamine amara subsp. amara TaxID=228776 RepID=A0ABD1AR61_CARAN